MTEQQKTNNELLRKDISKREEKLELELADMRNEVLKLRSQLNAAASDKLNFEKLKEKVGSGSDYILNAIKPIIEKYEEPGRQVVEKVETKVSESPFISVAAAFGVGVMVGTILNLINRSSARD